MKKLVGQKLTNEVGPLPPTPILGPRSACQEQCYEFSNSQPPVPAACEDYAAYLLRLGDGVEQTYGGEHSQKIRLPDEIAAPSFWTQQHLVHHTYPDLLACTQRCASVRAESQDYAFFASRAVLTPTNAMVNEINAEVLD